jgi:matrix metalloproteinase-14 (membrane-inserted)
MCAPIRDQVASKHDEIAYLKSLRYIGNDIDSKEQKSGIQHFQETWGLIPTGEMDDATEKWIENAKCGDLDEYQHFNNKFQKKESKIRSKRYTLQQNGLWPYNNITYKVSNLEEIVNKSIISDLEVYDAVAKAFTMWSKDLSLTFTYVEQGPVDIEISFGKRDHCASVDFDGPSRILAHAFGPGIKYQDYAGNIHLDAEESWVFNRVLPQTVDVFQAVAHELGHSIGLGHSNVSDSVMYPYYRNVPGLKLSEDDIQAIKVLYSNNEDSNIDFCHNAMDAFAYDINKDSFMFVSELFGKFEEYQLVEGYPADIQDEYPELPNKIDGAIFVPTVMRRLCITASNGEVTCTVSLAEEKGFYIFSGQFYFFFIDGVFSMDKFNEKGLITTGFGSGIPSDVDTVFTIQGIRFYFVKGQYIWRVTRGKSEPSVDKGYPQLLSDIFIGLPASGMTSAFNIVYNNLDGPNNRVLDFFYGTNFFTVTNFDGKGSTGIDESATKGIIELFGSK